MSIMDLKLELSDAQAITAVANTPSTNVIDWGAASLRVGAGTKLMLNVRVNTLFASGGAGTLVVSLETETDSAFGSAVTILSTPAIALGTLVKGYNILNVSIPHQLLEQCFRLGYTVGTTCMTAGNIDAWVSLEADTPV